VRSEERGASRPASGVLARSRRPRPPHIAPGNLPDVTPIGALCIFRQNKYNHFLARSWHSTFSGAHAEYHNINALTVDLYPRRKAT